MQETQRSAIGIIAMFILAVGACSVMAAGTSTEERDWYSIEAPHYTVFSMLAADPSATACRSLDALRLLLGETTRGLVLDSPVPTYVYLFDGPEAFSPYNLNVDGKPSDYSGWFLSEDDAQIIAMDATSGVSALQGAFHGYVRHVLLNTFGELPQWILTGVPSFYSTFQVTKDHAILGNPAKGYPEWLQSKPLPPLADVLSMTSEGLRHLSPERRSDFETEAWLLAHFLMIGDPSHTARVGILLDLIGKGAPADDALFQACGMDLETLDKALRIYARKGSYGELEYSLSGQVQPQWTQFRTMERKERLLRLGSLLTRGNPAQFPDATLLLNEVLSTDPAANPAWSSEAHLNLGVMSKEQGRIREALASFESAVAEDERNAAAHALLGQTLLDSYLSNGDHSLRDLEEAPPKLRRARKKFERASRCTLRMSMPALNWAERTSGRGSGRRMRWCVWRSSSGHTPRGPMCCRC